MDPRLKVVHNVLPIFLDVSDVQSLFSCVEYGASKEMILHSSLLNEATGISSGE